MKRPQKTRFLDQSPLKIEQKREFSINNSKKPSKSLIFLSETPENHAKVAEKSRILETLCAESLQKNVLFIKHHEILDKYGLLSEFREDLSLNFLNISRKRQISAEKAYSTDKLKDFFYLILREFEEKVFFP